MSNTSEVAAYLRIPAEQRAAIAERARCRTLKLHTATVRAAEFDTYVSASFQRLAQSNRRNVIAVSEAVSVLSPSSATKVINI